MHEERRAAGGRAITPNLGTYIPVCSASRHDTSTPWVLCCAVLCCAVLRCAALCDRCRCTAQGSNWTDGQQRVHRDGRPPAGPCLLLSDFSGWWAIGPEGRLQTPAEVGAHQRPISPPLPRPVPRIIPSHPTLGTGNDAPSWRCFVCAGPSPTDKGPLPRPARAAAGGSDFSKPRTALLPGYGRVPAIPS